MSRALGWIAAVVLATAGVARAEDLVVLVPAAEQPAPTAPPGTRAVTSLGAALTAASAHLKTCGACVVTVKVAAGVHYGPGRKGQWLIPAVKAPAATLRVFGGWDAAFERRTPLTTPSVLAVTAPRTGPVLGLASGGTALRELLVSGLAIDGGPGNRYDEAARVLQRGRSSSSPLLGFDGLTVERLIIADGIYLNAPAGVAAPSIKPASDSAEILVRNNVFANNVIAWQAKGTSTKPRFARYRFEANSFLLNFPGTADTSTSNPGALELGGVATATKVEIRGNLFAHNLGGAIVRQWDEARSPTTEIVDNLFWNNGELFAVGGPGRGALISRSGESTTELAPDELTAASAWTITGNVVSDPGVAVPVGKLVAFGQEAPAAAAGAPTADPLAAQVDLGAVFTVPEGFEIDAAVAGSDYAAAGVIKNYAPRMPFNLAALPIAKRASGHGASPRKVVTP